MAFHLFKKKNYADFIYEGGTIYTLDPEYPKASAIAVKNGKILLAGAPEELKEFNGPDTVHISLEGKYMVPGMLETMGTPVRTALQGFCLILEETMGKEDILRAVEEYFAEKDDADFCLAIEMNPRLMVWDKETDKVSEADAEKGETEDKDETEETVEPENTEEAADTEETEETEENNEKAKGKGKEDKAEANLKEMLGEKFPDKPVILASANGYSIMLSPCAEELVKARAEELEVHTITPEFVISTIVSNDFGLTAKQMFSQAQKYAANGITSVYSSEKYSFLENIYRDALLEAFGADLIKQRYFGSFHVDRCLSPASALYSAERKRTICQELNGLVNFNTIEIRFSSAENSSEYMPAEYIKAMGEAAADKGFHVRYLPMDEEAALQALDTAGNLSAAYHKLSFTVAHGMKLSEENLGKIYTGDAHELYIGGQSSGEGKGEDLLRSRTETAALKLGLIGAQGTLEEGKRADMAVFEKDPLKNLKQEAFMTIVAGKVVYRKGGDQAEQWADELSAVIDSNTEDIFAEEDNQ